jgi:hypothetical protein
MLGGFCVTRRRMRRNRLETHEEEAGGGRFMGERQAAPRFFLVLADVDDRLCGDVHVGVRANTPRDRGSPELEPGGTFPLDDGVAPCRHHASLHAPHAQVNVNRRRKRLSGQFVLGHVRQDSERVELDAVSNPRCAKSAVWHRLAGTR